MELLLYVPPGIAWTHGIQSQLPFDAYLCSSKHSDLFAGLYALEPHASKQSICEKV